MPKEKLPYFYYTLSIILIGDLFFKAVPIDLFFGLILTIQFLLLNKIENAFILIFFTGKIAGAYFISKGYFGFGGLFTLTGLLFILNQVFKNKYSIIRQYSPLLIILMSFFVSAFLVTKTSDGATKALSTFINGTIYFLSFSILFINKHKVSFEKIGMVMLLLGIYLLRFAIDLNKIDGPEHLLHFGFLRDQTNIYDVNSFLEEGDFMISYHLPGFLSLVALVFFMFDKGINVAFKSLFFIFTSFMVIYFAGARQNLLGFFVLIAALLYYNKKYSFVLKASILGLFTFILGTIISSSKSEILSTFLSSDSLTSATEASGRSIHYLIGISYFLQNPITGIGLGFHDYGNDARWPHNFFIELLCEIGIFGVFIVLLIMLISSIKNRKKIKYDFKLFLLLLPFFLRSMVSGSLTTNIVIISFLFSVYFFWRNTNPTKNYD